MRLTIPPNSLVLTLALGLASAGCGRGGSYVIEERRKLPAARPEQRESADTRMRFVPPPVDPHAGHGHGPGEHGHEDGAPEFDFDLPEGWRELPPAQFRDANFAISARPKLECYVSILGGGVAANLNRWRRQMGAEPLSDADIAALPRVKFFGEDGVYVEIDGSFKGPNSATAEPGYTTAGVVVEKGGASITAKLIGPADDVRAEADKFKALCASFGEPAKEPPPANGNSPPAAFDPSRLAWKAPEGWTAGPPKTMRAVTLIPPDAAGAECYVTILSGDGGGLGPNVNRWRGQLDTAPLSEAELAALPKMTVLGRDARLIEIDGGAQGMLGLVCELGSHAIFVKMTGPMETLKRERERFLEFCRSLT